MLCRLAIWNYHIQTLVKDNAEFDVTGMLNMYPQRVREGNHAFTAHLLGISAIFAWMSLCSSTNVGCGKPQIADEQKVDTLVFRCVGS